MYFLGRNTSSPFQNTSTNFIQLIADYSQLTLKIPSENRSTMGQLLQEFLHYHSELMEQYDQLDFTLLYNLTSTTLEEMLLRWVCGWRSDFGA